MHKKPLTILTATELQKKSGQILRRASQKRERFIVERAGYPVVVILSVQDYKALTVNEKVKKIDDKTA